MNESAAQASMNKLIVVDGATSPAEEVMHCLPQEVGSKLNG